MDGSANRRRRAFLLNVGLGTAGAAAAAIGAKALADRQTEEQKKPGQDPSRGGYRVSEHINNYYRTARV